MVTRNKKEAPETRTDTLLTEERLARYEGMARACAQIHKSTRSSIGATT